MLLVILSGVLALQAWTWRDLSGRVASGALTRVRASVRYVLWALLPPCAFLAAFLGAVGLEEWWGAALLPEAMGRAALPIEALLVGAAGLGSLGFAIRCAVLGRPAAPGG